MLLPLRSKSTQRTTKQVGNRTCRRPVQFSSLNVLPSFKEPVMPSRLVAIVFVLITPVALLAQERGKIKKVDADKGTVTITVDGKDQDFVVSGDTKFMGKNGPLEDGLKNAAFKEGTEVMFKYETDRKSTR